MFTKLLPLKSDFVFKLVFGDQRRVGLLTAFLQAVLDLPKDDYEKVTIIDPRANLPLLFTPFFVFLRVLCALRG